MINFFPFSIDKVPKVTSPVLVIHGTEDEVIDFSHGLAIFEKCQRAVEPLWVEVFYSFFRGKFAIKTLNLFFFFLKLNFKDAFLNVVMY